MVADFVAPESGELFLYVNDAIQTSNNDFLGWVKEEMKAAKTVEQAATEYKIPEKYSGYTGGRGGPANNIRTAYTEFSK